MRKKDEETFEQLFNELEETVAKLEEGNLTLDESLALYERGIQLSKKCGDQLDRAELRIKELTPIAQEAELDTIGGNDDEEAGN